jgi:hypothetical protein
MTAVLILRNCEVGVIFGPAAGNNLLMALAKTSYPQPRRTMSRTIRSDPVLLDRPAISFVPFATSILYYLRVIGWNLAVDIVGAVSAAIGPCCSLIETRPNYEAAVMLVPAAANALLIAVAKEFMPVMAASAIRTTSNAYSVRS